MAHGGGARPAVDPAAGRVLEVRRDLKLLLGAGLAQVLNAVFPVLASRKPVNTILVPTRQTKKKPGPNHSHHERLLGVARLLSQMAEPVMKAAIQITFLLARSFFIDLCTAVFSLLARIRVLIQQMLLMLFHYIIRLQILLIGSRLLRLASVECREYYPSMNDACTILECIWVKDKFVLHEKMKDSCQETQVEDQKPCGPESSTR
ncbi:uncharacterized protein [Setaria viridis]